ncbi:hypothetical protein HFO90_29190 [Rhizobium leguminosarum]|nr:hypothetical protein [Rhizobium leguminosarum]
MDTFEAQAFAPQEFPYRVVENLHIARGQARVVWHYGDLAEAVDGIWLDRVLPERVDRLEGDC